MARSLKMANRAITRFSEHETQRPITGGVGRLKRSSAAVNRALPVRKTFQRHSQILPFLCVIDIMNKCNEIVFCFRFKIAGRQLQSYSNIKILLYRD